ncbi:MAG: type II CRISPR RNA-guided endonuclease Cas9 [Verrucomicrobiota bacterium]
MQKQLTFSFDIGHSSIGWAVLSSEPKTRENPFPQPNLDGCGSVLFPKDDCLASSRRTFRRMRRNIRSTRQRIEQLKQLLLHLGVLSEEQLNEPGHPAPHLLAARAILANQPILTWHELWHLLRWYAHNRGYDGNSRWSRQEQDDEGDTEKEKTALELMAKHGTNSMAETICAVLGLKLDESKISSTKPYKTLNAAFPRKTVREEVLTLLKKHKGHLPNLDDNFIDTLIARDSDSQKEHRAWQTIPVPTIELPRRYYGGLLFGQLIPRFDNRIIARCPISGDKVPNKATREFLHYRWAMLLANIKADEHFLSPEQRQAVHAKMQEHGRLTPTELRKFVEELTGTEKTNISSSFEIHPDSKDALVLDPALAYFHAGDSKPKKNTTTLAHFWRHLPEATKHRALGRWKKSRPVNLQWMLDECTRENQGPSPLEEEIDRHFAADQKKKKPAYLTRDHFLRRTFAPKPLSGRAPYSRKVMNEVLDFVLSTDRHPTEAGKGKLPHGPIYRSKDILKAERDRPIDDLTNNHLIRQRLTILLRLVDDLLKNYADDNPAQVTDLVVEVARDLQEYSGLTAKDMSGELTKRLSHFKAAVEYLAEHAPKLPVNGSLIRKCRIAMDLEWKCPFTEKKYDAYDLPQLEREHIIPYSDRPTNSLDSLVLTFDWVNRLKGKRTALQFIKDVAEDERFLTPKNYEAFVNKLKTANPKTYPDDFRRQSSRKKLLMVETYEAKDHGFTQGSLTQTSHLNRLSARQLEKRFADPETGDLTVRITSIPGQVTAETRKGWRLLHTLDQACPDCIGKTKTQIRDLTHLHHALDASALALTHHYLPGTLPGQSENEKGKVWKALLDRNKTEEQIALLMRTGLFGKHYRRDKNGEHELDKNGRKKLDVHLEDKLFPDGLKQQLADRLAEQRVVQHIPADQSGAALELNPWRVWQINGNPEDPKTNVTLRQQNSTVGKDGQREIKRKEKVEKAGKLIGLQLGKLSKNKSVLIISENYGLALDPEPQIIPFHNVPQRLAEIKQANGGRHPRILRNGMLIRITNWPSKEGIWKIFSCKANLKLDLGKPDTTSLSWGNVLVTSLLKKNALEILNPPLTGLILED